MSRRQRSVPTPTRRSVLSVGALWAARAARPAARVLPALAAGCDERSGLLGSPALLSSRVQVGAYVHLLGHLAQDPVSAADLGAFEAMLRRPLDICHYFFTWGRPFTQALNAGSTDHTLMLSLKPDGNIVREVVTGVHDAYLEQFARDVAGFGRTVFLRYGHEMNGNWMSYSAGSPGGPTAVEFIDSWKHVVTVFRRVGAANARFVWCVNELDVPARAGNRMEDYWPGEAWVDVAGFDAYNWSFRTPRRGTGSWRSFAEIVDTPYRRVADLSRLPLWLCEFATTEAASPPDPGDASKSEWFRDMFASTDFPRLEALVYFSEDDRRDTHRDWRLDSSPGSVAAFRLGWAGRTGTVGRPAPTAVTA